MFRSMLKDFNDDPLFSANSQILRMERMMGGLAPGFDDMFGSPFAMPGFSPLMRLPALPANQGFSRGSRHRTNPLVQFGYPSIGPYFPAMDGLTSDPNCHSFSSSSVMTYSMGEDGQPKIYQASSSTRTAPGGVKEITNAASNSATGEHKMSIGRHLGERGHVMEKSRNHYTGDVDESEEFINMEDADANVFNQEWKHRTTTGSSRLGNQIGTHPYHRPTLAITDGSSRQEDRHMQKYVKKGAKKSKR